MPTAKSARSGGKRPRDPEWTKAAVLRAATAEFAKNGFSGARIGGIAKRSGASTRMIYYYYGSKGGLYRAVLESYYTKLRSAERNLELEDLAPLAALTGLIEFTYDWHIANVEGVRLVMAENIDRGRHLAALRSLAPINSNIIPTVERILFRGSQQGVFRPDLDAMDLYLSIAALCFFSISNRSTIERLFNYDMGAAGVLEARRRQIAATVLRSVVADLSSLDPPGRSTAQPATGGARRMEPQVAY